MRATAGGMLLRFEDGDAGPFGEDEAAALKVERPAGLPRLLVVAGERAHVGEAGDRGGRQAALGAAGDHDIDFAALDHVDGVDKGLDAGRAGCDGGHCRAMDPELHRHLATRHVRREEGDQERADPLGALLREGVDLVLDRRDATAAGVDHDANAVGVLISDLEIRLLQRLARGGHGELREAVHAAGGLEVHELLGHEVRDLAGDGDVESGRVESLNRADAGTTLGQTRPERVAADPQRADRAHTGHYNSCHQTLPFKNDDGPAAHSVCCTRSGRALAGAT